MENELTDELYERIFTLEDQIREKEDIINTIIEFLMKDCDCPFEYGYGFEEGTPEDKAQDMLDTDYCGNNCDKDNYHECWIKYFKNLSKLKKEGK